MKINIGKFKSYFGPYQLAEVLCFWAKNIEDEYGFKDKPEWVHNFGEWLAYGSIEKEELVRRNTVKDGSDRPITFLYKFLLWIEKKRKRKVEVHIDKWDTWGMDHNLAEIILPMLKQLKTNDHGSPAIDSKDVPKELRNNDSDDNYHKRWYWVLDEMIWAFEQILDEDGDAQFHTGVHDSIMIPLDKDQNEILDGDRSKLKFWRQEKTDKDTRVYDIKGHMKHTKRIDRGTTLFGKYFRQLSE